MDSLELQMGNSRKPKNSIGEKRSIFYQKILKDFSLQKKLPFFPSTFTFL